MPRILDLRDNPRLHLIGTDALDSITGGLEEIWLPESMSHHSFETILGLSALSTVRFEGDETIAKVGEGNGLLKDIIVEPFDTFGDVCCNQGPRIELSSPVTDLTFCDMQIDKPGRDAVYDSFELYIGASALHKLRPRSTFIGEATKSVETCAEFCSVLENCNYFSYDARWKESEHTCILLENNGTHSERECCKPDDYAVEGGPDPGWTSGQPPRTRHLVDNAAVLISVQDLIANKAGKFASSFEVSLGSNPIRGAVWIEPTLSFPTNQIEVSISPRRVALYNATMSAEFVMSVSSANPISTGATVVVTLDVMSCDKAFTSAAPEWLAEQGTVFIDVVPTEDMSHISHALEISGITFVVFQGRASGFFVAWTITFRNHAAVKMSQPIILMLVVLGCFIMSLSILLTTIQADYRYERPPLTGEKTDVSNTTIGRADAACMAFPWCFNVGFIIIFSALFAKIWRVRKLIRASSSFRRTAVGIGMNLELQLDLLGVECQRWLPTPITDSENGCWGRCWCLLWSW